MRTASGVFLLAVLVAALFLGRSYLAALVALVVAIGLFEYRKLWGSVHLGPNLLILVPLAAFWLFRYAYPQVPAAQVGLVAAALAGLALTLASTAASRPLARWAVAIGGGIWLGYLPGFVLLLYVGGGARGPELVLLTAGVSVLGDTAAYLVGSRWGRHPFMPAISPSKTWEGAVAGFLLPAAAVGALLPLVLPGLATWVAFSIASVASLAAIVGDLVESQLKRELGVKDSGRLVPGHGGILDRVDSLLFVAAVMYSLLALAGAVG
ncbi:MAG: phosphatidate cytidylyltransferase [Candidatus Dormiibacterota bacterium]